MVQQSSFHKLVGMTLGSYRLEQLIERDSLGPIFIVRATPANRLFLLRTVILPGEQTAEARIVHLGRFQREANQVASLQHLHILPLVDYGSHEGMPYLVWPYNPQMKSLYAHIARHGPLDTLTASRYLDQLAAALEYAHLHAVLHRNLTTHSILIEPVTSPQQARLTVTDFGVQRMFEPASQDGQKKLPLTIVESEGCSPEQLLGKAVDTSTDVYALGAVLYRLLTGHRAFVGKTRDDVMQQILHAHIPSLSTWRNDLPAGLDEIVARAMAKDPAKRFRQPVELANAYHELVAPRDTARPVLAVAEPLAAGDYISTPAQSPKLPARPIRPAQVSRRRVLIAGGASAVAVIAAAAYGAHLLTGSPSSSSPAAAGTPVTQSGGSSSTSTTPGQQGSSTIIARTADVPANSAKTFSIANQSNPGVLVHLQNSNTFVAFDSTCTHAGCAVNYNQQDKLLECPCHQAAFDPAKNAAVVQGPATTPLKAIAITVNADGTITTR